MDMELRDAIVDLEKAPGARPDDVSSPEAVVGALYEAISGPAELERERDWDQVRSLFLPGARLVLVRWNHPDGSEEEVLRAWDVEGFISTSRMFYRETSFFERALRNRTERFGHVAHVLSSYAAYVDPDDAEPVMRGVNSVQLVRDSSRWWIAGLVWDLERPGNEIPAAYLPEEEADSH
jgi:hypothetical protein